MGPVASPVYSGLDIEKSLAAFPPVPLRVRLLDRTVKLFPRRLFTWINPTVEAKIVSHILTFRKDLTNLGANPCPDQIELGVADETHVRGMASHEESFPLQSYLNRLQQGDDCFYLAIEGEIKAFQWVSYKMFMIYGGFDSQISSRNLAPDEAYTYDFYTYEKHRGKGYGQLLKQYVWQQLRVRNKNWLYSGIHHDNFVSLRIHLKSGFSFQELIYMYRLMDMTWYLRSSQAENTRIAGWLDGLGLSSQRPA